MRRAIALLLMLVFSSMLIAPLFASDPEANLPACCRRNGKHHCTMQRMPGTDGSPGFALLREKCPCYPAGTVAVHSMQFVPESGRRFHAAAYRSSLIVRPEPPAIRAAFLGGHPKRGPPSPLA